MRRHGDSPQTLEDHEGKVHGVKRDGEDALGEDLREEKNPRPPEIRWRPSAAAVRRLGHRLRPENHGGEETNADPNPWAWVICARRGVTGRSLCGTGRVR